MKVWISNGTGETELEFVRDAETVRFRWTSEEQRSADVCEFAPGIYSVLLGGRSYEARVEPSEQGLVVVVGGHRFEMQVRDPRRWNRQRTGRQAEGRQTITAPMPGKVVRVLVEPGDSVEAGQGLAVVEAMKMQNELKASKAGKVITVAARAGATVAAGDVLATIE